MRSLITRTTYSQLQTFFPDFLSLLRQLPDSGNQSCITYPAHVLLMTRILSALFYISSTRKTSLPGNHQPLSEKDGPERTAEDCITAVPQAMQNRVFEQARIRGDVGRVHGKLLLEGFLRECQKKGWKYLLRFKEGSIPGRRNSGTEESLLSNPDRSYDSADNGSMGAAVEECEAELGAEAQESAGIL